jgi:peptidyl-prolyl cis-trans isomerase SurA
MQEISAAHNDLLRNLIDQQLWLSKGKELGITGETELVNRMNEIRKQYHMETLEDLEKAAREQGISFEDFKANIRNQIITQAVMRQEVGQKVQFTSGEAERYFEQHKQDYAQPESVTLAEILVSTGTPAPSATVPGGVQPDDPAKLAEAKAKADDLEAKLHAGGDFAQLARTFSDGPTAATGGDLGQFRRGALAKVLEDSTFALKAGEYTEPIRTKQGYVILKVVQHITGGVPQYKDVQEQVEQNFYVARMEPATRDYLTTMREQAFIDIKPGYADTGASSKETKPVFSAYTPPAPKKKKKVERTRFRENTRTFRQKSPQAAAPETETAAPAKKGKKKASAGEAAMNSGKKEKIRYGRAPAETLPGAPQQTATEDLGAVQQTADASQPANPLETSTRPEKKKRFSERAKQPKKPKAKGPKKDTQAPSAPDAAEVADRSTQSGPLGLAGGTPAKKKKSSATKGEKTRLSYQKQKQKQKHEAKPDQDSRDMRGW